MVRVGPREHRLTREPCASSCIVPRADTSCAGFIAPLSQKWKKFRLNESFTLNVVNYFMLQMGQKIEKTQMLSLILSLTEKM